MFMVNTYRWDYAAGRRPRRPAAAADLQHRQGRHLPARRRRRTSTSKSRRIYALLQGASDKLGLQITEGPHKDTQELHIHAFRWFNRFLKDERRADRRRRP